MKAFLRAQLERYNQRLAELDFLLSREDIMKDMTGFMALSRERTEVGAVAERYQQHQQRQADAQAAAGLLTHEDADMRALGQEEAAQASQDMARLEAELQRMLDRLEQWDGTSSTEPLPTLPVVSNSGGSAP